MEGSHALSGIGATRADVLKAGAGAFSAALVAACGGSGGPATQTQAAPVKPSAPVEIEYWSTLRATHPEGKGRLEAMQLSERANAEYVKVKYEQEGGSNWEKIVAALSAGQPPNLLVFRPNNAAQLFDMGAGIDVETELKSLPAWAKVRPTLPQNFLEGITWRGKLVGIPLYTVNLAMMYAPDHLEKAGVVPPTST